MFRLAQEVPMTKPIVEQLSTIVDELEEANELACAAHLQLVIDRLEERNQAIS